MATIEFWADRTTVSPGECATLHWRVDGVKAVYYYAEGQRWQDGGVVGEGSRQECPPHTMGYNLRVVKQDDSVETHQISIQVQAGAQPPTIQAFSVSPPDRIPARGCVQIQWRVAGTVQHVRLTANDRVIWDGAPMSGEVQDCPPGPGKVVYRIKARGPGGTRRAKHPIHVGDEVKPPPQPVDPNLPVIAEFAVVPDRIPAGGCVQLRWRTAGNTSWVNIVRGEHIVWDNAPLEGTKTDCPEAPGTYTYRLVAFNPEDERVREDRKVQVG